ncbi:hypothetical protein SDRG_07392 [Saprolegnia diclina VS20]|uniref:Uncharacterized protein n=1 Tax=Saprolegnia diclina (strain VS20) TaxID=1156394 RepID=T0QMV6_SAPDV|nr:hypothetical protein SDRG_07392 [Saprolegnia diclina VS20]EQC35160.1 hypothetical protein SDRG_07392 [Saprolegnia diclina VS20]|eukprot:XP_008611444.1 hypothetical protein SDRG_07392 [Saprolegnia diclina VS20]
MAESCDDPTGVCLRKCAHVNWTSICALGFSNNWACCDLNILNAVLPTTLWTIFLGISLWFGWFTGIVRELRTSVDDLHDINTQALGVVVARQTQSVLGREIGDPRRVLMLLAMGTELVGFSYLPVQLLLYEYTNGTFTAQSSAGFQWLKFCLLTLLLWLLLLPRRVTRRIDGLLTKVVAPLLFDTCSLFYMYTIIDIGACSNGMDTWVLPDGTTCGSESRYGVFAALGTASFVLFYWHSLQYKLRLNDQVFAVRFRYQTSFGSLMAYTRTACCLGFFTVQRLLLYFNKIHVFLAFSIFNMVLFSLLLRYNYVNQPCLGVGLFPNNLRSLSFATSVYTSTILFGISCALQASGAESMSLVQQYVLQAAAVAYLPFAAATWAFNSRRARLYHVPNLSLKASLVHSTPRVRAIAAVSIALEDQSRWSTSDILDLLTLLDENLKASPALEEGLVLAYTCQALWNLYFKYVSIDTPFREPGTDPTLSLGLWANQRLSTSNYFGPTNFHSRTRSHGSALLALVQRNVAIGAHTMTQHMDDLSSSPHIASILPNCIHALVLLSRMSASPTRLIAAKVLQEMYVARILRLSQPTMLYVCCSICASSSPSQSSAAAATLRQLFVSHFEDSELMTVHFTDYWNLLHLSQYLLRASRDPSEVGRAEGVAGVVLSVVQMVESHAAACNPANALSEAFVANILATQAQITTSYKLLTLLDDICLSTHWAFQVYLDELHRATQDMTMRKSKRQGTLSRARLFSQARSMTAIAPTLAPPRHAELSVQKVTSFLLQSKQANLIEPDVVAAIKKRKRDEAMLIVQVTMIMNEGCQDHLGVRELRPNTLAVLKTVVRHLQDQPMLRTHIKHRLKPAEVDYFGHLELLLSTKHSSGLRAAMLSAGKIMPSKAAR